MNASLQYPFDLHWTPHDLASAVPARLTELLVFHARRDGVAAPSANAGAFHATRREHRYLGRDEASLFRIA